MQVSTHDNPAVRDPYLGTADAASYYRYSESHFRVLVRTGKVPRPTRINGKLLWRQSVLDAHMRQLEIAQGVVSATS